MEQRIIEVADQYWTWYKFSEIDMRSILSYGDINKPFESGIWVNWDAKEIYFRLDF